MSRGALAAHGTTADAGNGDWRHEAACLDHDAETFFPIGTTGSAVPQIAAAIAICAPCPVRAQCLKYALDNFIVDGVWGGLSEEERRSFKRRTDRQRRASMEASHPQSSQDYAARGLVPADAVLQVVIAKRAAGTSWRQIGRLLGTSDSTCREVYAGTRFHVARATEETARALAQQLVGAQ